MRRRRQQAHSSSGCCVVSAGLPFLVDVVWLLLPLVLLLWPSSIIIYPHNTPPLALAFLVRSSSMPSLRRLRWRNARLSLWVLPNKNSRCGGGTTVNPDEATTTTTTTTSSSTTDYAVSETTERVRYETAVTRLQEQLRDPTLAGPAKHRLHCRHRWEHGRQPGVCARCWSYRAVCVCHGHGGTGVGDNTMPPIVLANQTPLRVGGSCTHSSNNNPRCSVVLWTHHKEWGSPSNTGRVLRVALNNSNCRMLLKGLEEHDAQLQELLDNSNSEQHDVVLPVVLWTDNQKPKAKPADKDRGGEPRQFVSMEQLREELGVGASAAAGASLLCHGDDDGDSGGLDGAGRLVVSNNNNKNNTQRHHLILIALEGTWGQARRMLTRLPTTVRGLSLSHEQIFDWRRHPDDETTKQKVQSLLHPLRKPKQPQSNTAAATATAVCTAEAVVSALRALECLTMAQAHAVLALAERKVRDTAAYQGKGVGRGAQVATTTTTPTGTKQ